MHLQLLSLFINMQSIWKFICYTWVVSTLGDGYITSWTSPASPDFKISKLWPLSLEHLPGAGSTECLARARYWGYLFGFLFKGQETG